MKKSNVAVGCFCLSAILIAFSGGPVRASEVFQYEAALAPLTTNASDKGVSGWLWVPPKVRHVRGLLLGGIQDFVFSDEIRAACADAGVGMLVPSPMPVNIGDDMSVSGMERLDALLGALAEKSGHPELTKALFMPYGWSAGTVWSSRFAFAFPERCFASMTFKGGFCVPAPGKDTTKVSNLPWLHIQGQFEEFGPGPSGVLRDHENRATGSTLANTSHIAFRAANPDLLIGLIIDAGATHMGWNPRLYPMVASFIAASARLRLPPADGSSGAPLKVDVAQGFLMDRELAAPRYPIAAAAEYKGPAAEAHWYPDRTMAEAAARLHRDTAKKPQYVTVLDARGAPMDVGHDMRFRYNPTFSGADTFKVAPGFNTAFVPKKYPPQDGPLTNAPGPVLARPNNGCMEQVDAVTFRIAYSPFRGNGWVSIYHPGNEEFRYAEQVIMPRIPGIQNGAAQTIAFDPPAKLKTAGLPLKLAATATSGLPVRFSVRSGPARIVDGNTLELADVPDGAPRPLVVKVVAWQLGSRVAPFVAEAAPVTATLEISD
jgi:hypothetical protein